MTRIYIYTTYTSLCDAVYRGFEDFNSTSREDSFFSELSFWGPRHGAWLMQSRSFARKSSRFRPLNTKVIPTIRTSPALVKKYSWSKETLGRSTRSSPQCRYPSHSDTAPIDPSISTHALSSRLQTIQVSEALPNSSHAGINRMLSSV